MTAVLSHYDTVNSPLRADGRERLQGELTVSRSIGDLPYRAFGLTAEPEFAPWRSVLAGALLRLLIVTMHSDALESLQGGAMHAQQSEQCATYIVAMSFHVRAIPRNANPNPLLTRRCPLVAGDAFLILASDGLLQAATPDEVCSLADALASGLPPPKPLAAAPVAIPLGPSAAAGLPVLQQLFTPSHPGNCTGPQSLGTNYPGQLRCRWSGFGTGSCRPMFLSHVLQRVLAAGQVQHCSDCELDCEPILQTAATRAQAVAEGCVRQCSAAVQIAHALAHQYSSRLHASAWAYTGINRQNHG